MAKQQKILDQENLFLTPLKEMQKNLETYIEKEEDQKIVAFTLDEKAITFIQNIGHMKEVNEFLNAIAEYKKICDSLMKSLEDERTKKENVEEQIKNLDGVIEKIEQSLQKIRAKKNQDPFDSFVFYSCPNSFSEQKRR